MQRRSSFIELSVRSLPCLLPGDYSSKQHGNNTVFDIQSGELDEVQRSNDSPASLVRQPQISAAFGGSQVQTVEEARIFTHYVRILSYWVDVCDKKRHFATEVPRRALQMPLLAYSLLAVSSRQLGMVSNIGTIDPAAYHDKALRLLIPKLNGPVEDLDENVLASIVLLRNYEEMTGRRDVTTIRGVLNPMYPDPVYPDLDAAMHLAGAAQLLNSISHFMGDDGLGEAASWIALRADMYFSLTRSLPMKTRLETYTGSVSFLDNSPGSIANRIIYICGRIQSRLFVAERPTIQDWTQYDAEVQDWYDTKPWRNRPMWVQEVKKGSAFPYLWFSHAAEAVGYQHYYLSKLLLAMFHPEMWEPGFDNFIKRRATEEIVIANTRLIIGIAVSNPSFIHLRFLASHTLQACGALLSDPTERVETLKFLQAFESEKGWVTKGVVAKLKKAWGMDMKKP